METTNGRCPYCGREPVKVHRVPKTNRFMWACEACITANRLKESAGAEPRMIHHIDTEELRKEFLDLYFRLFPESYNRCYTKNVSGSILIERLAMDNPHGVKAVLQLLALNHPNQP